METQYCSVRVGITDILLPVKQLDVIMGLLDRAVSFQYSGKSVSCNR